MLVMTLLGFMLYVMFLCCSVRHVGYDIAGFYAVYDVFVLFSQIRQLMADGADGTEKHKELIEVSWGGT